MGSSKQWSRAIGVAFVVLAASAFFAASAFAQSELPEGPDRDLVGRVCQTCHGLSVLMGASGQSLASWVSTIDQMEGNGLQVTADERAKIIEYLATFLGPRKTEPAAAVKEATPEAGSRAGLR